jgi:outer membrane protein
MYFSSKKNTSAHSINNTADSVKHKNQFRIAYFEMDSVEANFEMVKLVMAELNAKEQEITNEMDRLGKEIQQKYNYYQNLASGGNLSQQQSETASQEMKMLDEKMRNRKQQLDQSYYDLKNKRQNEIKTKIEAFLKEYNKDQRYSYIISYEQGLFYYKDTTYNITADLVKGLNALYKAEKK